MLRMWIGHAVLLSFVSLLWSICLTASVPGGDQPPSRVQVSIENYAFTPDPVTVAAGTTVVWMNRDEVAYTVVSNDKLFSSPELEPNASFEFTFKKAGTYAYFCTLHPEMKGKVVVK